MRKRVVFSYFGLFLMILGFSFMSINATITGFVVDEKGVFDWLFFMSALCLIFGVMVVGSAESLEQILDQNQQRVFAFGVGKRDTRNTARKTEQEIGLSPKEYSAFLLKRKFDQGPKGIVRESVHYHDSYENDLKELMELKGGERNEYLRARLQELGADANCLAANPPMLGEIKSLIKTPLPEVELSRKAAIRAASDSTVFEAKDKYRAFIEGIVKSRGSYEQHPLGEFNVSPGRHNKYQVAWTFDPKRNVIQVHDFLYHINNKDYVDHWNRKAANKEITLDDYRQRFKWNGTDFKEA